MESTGQTLQLDDDLPGQRREWRVERVGWVAMGLIVAAALLGVFGGGPLSHAYARADGVELRYERFQREQAPDAWRLAVDPALTRGGRFHVRVDQTLLDVLELDRIEPQPVAQVAGPGYVDSVFDAHGGDRPASVDFRFRPARIGRITGRVTIDDGAPLFIDQFVYP
jgi:hypothetical protein